ncbi:DUF2798 domain-containing protein [Virgibacillus sp. DJP39]|uniref:DUF2798 domain-containing protein n=1 Tax=Virgibacillus sp. DJP39 TaxID=3409790 RepID=UPI003BB4E22B
MCFGMVLIMSVYGLVLTSITTGIKGSFFIAYLKITGLNFIVTLPSQLLIVGPISRRLLTTTSSKIIHVKIRCFFALR